MTTPLIRGLTYASQGEHTLTMPRDILGPTCGILPVGSNEAKVTTSGLEWNLSTSSCESGIVSLTWAIGRQHCHLIRYDGVYL